MPLARIDVPTGKSADYRSAIGEVVYNALNVPQNRACGSRYLENS